MRERDTEDKLMSTDERLAWYQNGDNPRPIDEKQLNGDTWLLTFHKASALAFTRAITQRSSSPAGRIPSSKATPIALSTTPPRLSTWCAPPS